MMLIDADILDLEDDDEGVSAEEEDADSLMQWRRSAQTSKGREGYTIEREKAIYDLVCTALTSSDPKVSRAAAKIQTLDQVVKFFGGKTKEEELR